MEVVRGFFLQHVMDVQAGGRWPKSIRDCFIRKQFSVDHNIRGK